MKPSINNRFQAFTAHFLISLIIFTLFIYLMIYWWYPPPYFELDGGEDVLQILFGVDVILGPLLTLVVFRKDKPGLFFDLSVIASIQIAALFYGGSVIYHERPAFIVFAVDRFTLVSTQDIDMKLLIGSDLIRRDFRGPIPVFTALPENASEKSDIMFNTLFDGAGDLEFRAEYYEPFQPNIKEAAVRSRKITQYYLSAENKVKINHFLKTKKLLESDLSFFPVVGKKKDMLIAVHNETGNVEGAIDIDPWIND